MPGHNADLAKFAGYDAQVVGISVDSIPCHIAWQRHEIGTLDYPLCSDFYPHGAVAELYGLVRLGPPITGINERAIFIVDKQGKIAFARMYELGEQPPNEELFRALAKMQD